MTKKEQLKQIIQEVIEETNLPDATSEDDNLLQEEEISNEDVEEESNTKLMDLLFESDDKSWERNHADSLRREKLKQATRSKRQQFHATGRKLRKVREENTLSLKSDPENVDKEKESSLLQQSNKQSKEIKALLDKDMEG